MPRTKKRLFDVVTIFPEVINAYTDISILGRAKIKGLIQTRAHDLRTWTFDRHRTVDDTPYGGGPGMVMKVEPFDQAVQSIRLKGKKTRIILTSASGSFFTEQDAKRLAQYDQIIFLCGRYEGVDARVEEYIADESLSIGSYVLTGGELPALVMLDAIARLVPGVLGKKESLTMESHTQNGCLEYPQYTKPEQYRGWKVPPVLLSGNHKEIETWREKQKKYPS
ncbi:TPA: tRNA (guanosine(37)-N1)-methyltransferase TrmD [Candidatus Uhrbacteria bacterium]|nr:tRNA (guanosine(37)-N1)-methyltransferase TrmD [Candidatus Uhrbacteria bacterium]